MIKKRKVILFTRLLATVILIGLFIVGSIFFYLNPQPKKDSIALKDMPETFVITQANRMDYQTKFECAAFSSAYILRHFQKEAQGMALYKNYPCKLPSGVVATKGILNFFKKQGMKVTYYEGTLDTLKKRVSEGTPVIVFIKVFKDKNYMHFVPVVGYDKTQLFLAESLDFLKNEDTAYYNRSLSNQEFNSLWKVKFPFKSYTYFVIQE